MPSIERLEHITAKGSCGDLWILTHEDLRATARVRAFIDYMLNAFEQHRDLLEGRLYTQSVAGFGLSAIETDAERIVTQQI